MTITVLGSEIELLKNNKKYFIIYIWIQTIQVLFGLLYTGYIIWTITIDLSKFTFYMLALSLISEVFFSLMLVSLIIFHTYLIFNNLTTWESLSWNKISYMRLWPRKYGSPFDRGSIQNLKLYFWEKSKSKIIIWKMPKKLPSIQQGEKIIKSRRWSYLLEKLCIRCQ